MPNIYIHLHESDGPPQVDHLDIDSGEKVLIVRFSHDLSVGLPGYGADAIEYAHALADELHRAANAIIGHALVGTQKAEE